MKRFYLLVVCMCLLSAGLWAQTKVTGTVFDENGEGAIGANILVEGTTTGTVTDFDGRFELTVPEGKKNLVISYLGYKTATVPVKPTMKVTLETETQQIQEVVVTGMVAQDKRLFSGAATKLDASETMLSGMTDVSRSLEGRAAGVSVQTVSGTFGAAPKIRVRGATSIYGSSKPLWVVDGVIMEDAIEVDAADLSSGNADNLISNAIAGVNADDIESIQILKDGSATSIYGARAMAGVIVVNTKKGKAGQTSLNYTGEITYRMKPSYRDYNICNSQEQMDIYKELSNKGWLEASNLNNAKNAGVYGKMLTLLKSYDPETGKFALENSPSAINAYLREAEYRNTDWFDLLFNNNVMMNHSLSFTTGTERAQVRASLSAMYDPGWYKRSGVQRYTGNANASFELLPKGSSQKLTLKVATSGSYINQEAPGTSDQQTDAVTGVVSRGFDINPFSFAMNSSRVLDPNEKYRRNYCDFNIFDELEQNYMKYKRTDVKFQGELSYKPIKGLEIAGLASIRYNSNEREHNIMDNSNQARAYRAGLGIDPGDVENDLIRDANEYLYNDPDDPSSPKKTILPQGGIYNLYVNKLLSVDLRGTISYNRGFANNGQEGDDHIINAFAGVESNSTDRQSVYNRGWGYQYENGGVPYYDYHVFKQGQEENTQYYKNDPTYYRNLAFFGTATYSYKSRYSVTGTIRYEGSNKLGKSLRARWLPTWNVSGVWNADAERFWRPTFDKWWTTANLKLSYSLTADRGPADNSLAKFMAYSPWRPLAGVTETGIELESLENSELTYEKKYEFNIGTTLGFFNDRLSLIFDWYTRNNFDLIGYVYTAGVGGETMKIANDATMKSSGIELTLSTVNVDIKNFRWTSDLTFSHHTNKITKLQDQSNIRQLVSGMGEGRMVDYPLGALFSFRFAGLTEDGLPTFYSDDKGNIFGPVTETTSGVVTTQYSEINMQDREDYKEGGIYEGMLKYEGPIDPTIDGGFSNTFTIFNNLKVGIFFTYGFGNVIRLSNLCYTWSSTYDDLTASPREMKNRWTTPGDEATTTIPVIASRRQFETIEGLRYAYQAYNYSDQRVAKGDFIRLKEISVEYAFPKKWFEGQKAVSSFSAKFSGTNLALLYADKKLNGMDPEFFNVGGTASPVPRQFTLTFHLGF
ncbi:MAG: SusC/RagA family TonB-linked outer membrane protein [Paludibacteraceae bacterium]|nr:SusC/RagA family TonB-linked outer membrane protein [Paludibacteraceae bacterium]